MNNLQKMGGLAALVNGIAYIVGIGLVVTYLAPIMDSAPAEYLAFMVDNQTLLHLWHLLIYLVAGVFMVPLALALHERLKDGAPALMQAATAFGLVWVATVISSGMVIVNDLRLLPELYAKDPAQATTVFLALSAVERGLGGSIELPGGLWLLLVSLAGLRAGGLPRALNYFGLLIGGCGIATAFPLIDIVGYGFGIGAIGWFLWVGVVLLRGARAPRLAGARLA